MDLATLEQQSNRARRLAMAALSLLVLAYVAFFSWRSWTDERENQIAALTTIMELGEKSIDTYFYQFETALQSLALDIQPGTERYNPERARELLRRFKSLHAELSNVALVRMDGLILVDAITPPTAKPITLAQSSSFAQYARVAGTGPWLRIGQPTLSRTANIWVVPIRYGIKSRGGRVTHALVVTLPVEFLQSFWKDAPITKQAAIGILRDDGFLLSRYPVPSEITSEEVYGKPRSGALMRYLQQQKFPVSGHVIGASSLEGSGFLNVFQRLSHYPLTLFVAMPMQTVYELWWSKISITYLLAFLFVATGVLVYFLAMRRQHVWNEERVRMERVKAEFVSVVSHELRTPITSIRGSLGLLDSGVVGPVPPEAEKMIAIAHKNSLRLITLVDDILDMEKLLSGKLAMTMERVDLVALVRQSLEANEAYAESLQVRYALGVHPEQAWVLASESRLLQVMANLLSNAAKFSLRDQPVDVRIVAEGRRFRVEVEDHGRGISESFRPQVFQPFAQADMSNTRRRGGTGLGLSISKELIEKMGGRIGFETEEGHGTTFWFELPKHRESTQGSPE